MIEVAQRKEAHGSLGNGRKTPAVAVDQQPLEEIITTLFRPRKKGETGFLPANGQNPKKCHRPAKPLFHKIRYVVVRFLRPLVIATEFTDELVGGGVAGVFAVVDLRLLFPFFSLVGKRNYLGFVRIVKGIKRLLGDRVESRPEFCVLFNSSHDVG